MTVGEQAPDDPPTDETLTSSDGFLLVTADKGGDPDLFIDGSTSNLPEGAEDALLTKAEKSKRLTRAFGVENFAHNEITAMVWATDTRSPDGKATIHHWQDERLLEVDQ